MTNSTPDSRLTDISCEATVLWLSGQYDACVQTLQRLETLGQTDGKTSLNVAVADYYCKGCNDATSLLDLTSRLLAHGSTDLDNCLADPTTANPNNPGEGFSVISTPDAPILQINKAILLFSLKQFREALAIAEPLYHDIESLHDGTAIRLCLLLIDLYARCGCHKKAAAVVTLLDKSARSWLLGRGTKQGITSIEDLAAEAERDGDGVAVVESPRREPRSCTPDQQLVDYSRRVALLPALSKLKGAVLSRAQDLLPQLDSKALLGELRRVVKLCKVRVHLSARSYKAAKRELKGALMALPRSEAAAMMRAELEVLRQNPKKACKLLVAMVQEREAFGHCHMQLLNNLGVVHHHLGKHQLAAIYLTKALQVDAAALHDAATTSAQADGCGTCHPAVDQRHAVLYNTGMQHLMLKRHHAALECLQQAAPTYCNQPMLWLRLAESSIGMYRDEQHQRCCADSHRSLAPSLTTESSTSAASTPQQQTHDPATAQQSLSYALHALLTARHLLQQHHAELPGSGSATPRDASGMLLLAEHSTDAMSMNGTAEPTTPAHSTASISSNWDDCELVQQAVLANLAYVHLLRDDPLPALNTAKLLLDMPSLTPQHSLLARCYAAEALCMLGQPQEAMECLREAMAEQDEGTQGQQPTPATSSHPGGPEEDGSSEQPHVLGNATDLAQLTGPAARACLYLNMASVLASQRQLEQAARSARQALLLSPGSHRAQLMLAYVELGLGHLQPALVLLRHHAVQ